MNAMYANSLTLSTSFVSTRELDLSVAGTHRVVATDSVAQSDNACVEIITYLQRDLVSNIRHSSTGLTPARITTGLENHGVRALFSDCDNMRVDARALSARHGAVVRRLGDKVAFKVEDLVRASTQPIMSLTQSNVPTEVSAPERGNFRGRTQ